MTISLDEDGEPMATRSLEKDSQHRQFCETRINEIHSILNEDVADNLASNICRQKVQFVCIPSTKLLSENNGIHSQPTKKNKDVGAPNNKDRSSFACDILLLAAASKACGSVWLTRELEGRFVSDTSVGEDTDVIILLPDEEAYNDLEFLIESLTVWTPTNPSRVLQILESRVGKILGFHQLLVVNNESQVRDQNRKETKENEENDLEARLTKDMFEDTASAKPLNNSLKCYECQRCFTQRKLLNRHIRTVHAENNPNTCQDCGRRCRGPAELVIHKRIHNKEKPFECSICSSFKSFAQRSQLNDHMNKVHLTKTLPSSYTDISKPSVSLLSQPDCQNFEDDNETLFLEEEMPPKRDAGKKDKLDKEMEEYEKQDDKKDNSKAKNVCDICDLALSNSEAAKRHEKIHFQPNVLLENNRLDSSVTQSMDCTENEKLKEDEKHVIPIEDSSKELVAASPMYRDVPKQSADRPREEHSKEEKQSSQAETSMTKSVYMTDKYNAANEESDSNKSLNKIEKETGTTKPYSCAECGKQFRQKSHLTVHRRCLHSQDKPFMCPYCGKLFSVASNHKKHVQMHQHREESKEVMKPKEKKDESLLNPILKLESDSNESEESVRPVKTLTEIQQRLICEICGLRNFESVKEMNTHSKTHSSQNTSFVCKYCPSNNPMSFPRKIQLRIHERKVHEKHLIKQSKIESEIGSSLEVTKEKEHQLCEVCNYECISKSALEKHILTHTKERPHECPECRKRFVQTSQVNYHIKTVHAPPGTLRLKHHSCLECGAKFSTASTLRKHYRTHTGDRPHICKRCGKGFIQKVHLRNHEMKHTGERPYLCIQCGKSFLTSSNLKEHSKLHCSAEPAKKARKTLHACQAMEGCDAKYASAVDLKIHERIHTGERPFSCSMCSKSFRSKRILLDHYRSHTGAKPYQCRNCNKAFSSAAGLRQHFKRQESCNVAKIPGAFSISQVGHPIPATLGLPQQAESVQYFLPESTNQERSNLAFLNTTENDSRNDAPNIPHGRHDGIITHVDDSGTETTLFLDHESPYSSTSPSFVVKSNPMNVDRFVDSDLLQRSRGSDLVLSNQHHQVNPSDQQIDITSATLITNTTGNSEQISVSNLEAFPFTLTVESSQEPI